MTRPILRGACAPTPRRAGARSLPRWPFVAAAVALLGVSIDLFQGPPASALTSTDAPIQASSFAGLDRPALPAAAEQRSLEPGASIAAYGP